MQNTKNTRTQRKSIAFYFPPRFFLFCPTTAPQNSLILQRVMQLMKNKNSRICAPMGKFLNIHFWIFVKKYIKEPHTAGLVWAKFAKNVHFLIQIGQISSSTRCIWLIVVCIVQLCATKTSSKPRSLKKNYRTKLLFKISKLAKIMSLQLIQNINA